MSTVKPPPTPFSVGESVHRNLQPLEKSGLFLSSGRWTLSPKALLPYVSVEVPSFGGRELTWGETIEVPQGSNGVVTNTSAHAGDAIFAAAGHGHGFASKPPGQVSLPVTFSLHGDASNTSNFVDTRRAKRAYLCTGNNPGAIGPLAPTVTFNIIYRGDKRGTFLVPLGFAAANGGQLINTVSATGYKQMIPLGYGSGNMLDAAGNNQQELRPMALFDSLMIKFDPALGENSSIANLGGSDHYFLLEY